MVRLFQKLIFPYFNNIQNNVKIMQSIDNENAYSAAISAYKK